MDFAFEVETDLLFLVHLDDGFVLDIHGSGGVVEGGDGFFGVGLGGGDAGDHEGFGGAAEGVLEEHGKFGVTVRDMLFHKLLITETLNHLTQHKQTLIDIPGLLHHLPL